MSSSRHLHAESLNEAGNDSDDGQVSQACITDVDAGADMVLGEDWTTSLLAEWRRQWSAANFHRWSWGLASLARYPTVGTGGHWDLENPNIQQLGVETHATDTQAGDEFPIGAEAIHINNNHIDSDINTAVAWCIFRKDF